jgi:hypothetical protein
LLLLVLRLSPVGPSQARLVKEKIPRDTRSKPGPGNGIYSPENRAISSIMMDVAEGRVAQVTGNSDKAVEHLRKAVDLQVNSFLRRRGPENIPHIAI